MKKRLTVILGTAHGKNVAGKRSPDGIFQEWQYSREIVEQLRSELTGQAQNVAIYIDNPHDLPLPFFELDVRIVPLEKDTYKQDIAMQSPRFILQNGNVFCTEVPTINRIEPNELGNSVVGSKRTNIYLRKKRKHGRGLINHFDNKGSYIKNANLTQETQ